MEGMAELVAAATAVRARAYAPYSGFAVGAAVREADGSVHCGCNVENASYPEGMCAEASAVAAMVASGGRRIAAMAVAGGDGKVPCWPCGGCRQRLMEFGTSDTVIWVADATGRVVARTTLGDLIPRAFGGEILR